MCSGTHGRPLVIISVRFVAKNILGNFPYIQMIEYLRCSFDYKKDGATCRVVAEGEAWSDIHSASGGSIFNRQSSIPGYPGWVLLNEPAIC